MERVRNRIVALYVALAALLMPSMAFAAEETVTYSTFSDVVSAITGQVSVTNILGIIAGVVAAAIVLVFMWWGVRKIIQVIFSAFRKGRANV